MNTEKERLIAKYNVPGPRYTSYPTVPYWDNSTFSAEMWRNSIAQIFNNKDEEISIYIHLPYCESLCTFCGCNTRITVNHAVEIPYIDMLLKEWNLYLALMEKMPVVKELHLGGGTPTFFSPDNLKRLINGITQNIKVAPDAELGFEGHPNNTTREHLQTLYDLGFRRVSYGIQDFDPRVQQVINRIQPFEKVKEVFEASKTIGYSSVNFDVVYGLPLQTLEGINDTIQKVKALGPDRIAFYSYAHVPWLKPGQRKFTELDLPEDDVKRSLYETGRAMLEEAGYIEIGMDHFALSSDSLYKASQNRVLHRNFMGYTVSHSKRLIGLGVSSISDLWGAYAQNVKTVEEYKRFVDEGRLPVFRGHTLTEEDLILRRHILNVMCRLKTSWTADTDQCEFIFEALENMKDLENDGLVKIDKNSLTVTEKGRPFIRNICMALDARMKMKEKDRVHFSKVI